jgi:hypothetical protein
MPPLSFSWLREQTAQSLMPTPSQRVLRVLQVTRTHWQVTVGGRRKHRHDARSSEPLLAKHE